MKFKPTLTIVQGQKELSTPPYSGEEFHCHSLSELIQSEWLKEKILKIFLRDRFSGYRTKCYVFFEGKKSAIMIVEG